MIHKITYIPDENAKLSLEVNSEKVVVNGQTITKGVAFIEKGTVSKDIKEEEPEIPAVVPTSTPISSPTATAKAASTSSGKSGGSSSSGNKQTSTPTPEPTPTSIPETSATATAVPVPTPTPTTEPISEPTTEPTPELTPTPTPTVEDEPTPSAVPTELQLVSATADNLKEVVLKFNKPLPNYYEATDPKNYYVSYDTSSNISIDIKYVELSEDRMTVTLLLNNQIQQQSDIKVTVKSKIGLSEDAVVVLKNVKDITRPTIVEIEAWGNSALKVTFSEPLINLTDIDNFCIDELEIQSKQPIVSFNEKTVIFNLLKPLQPGVHKFYVKNKVFDYAYFYIEDNEVQFTVIEDTVPPSGVVESATQTEVVIKFNERVKPIDVDNIITDPDAYVDYVGLSDDNMTLKIYFDVLKALREEGALITIKNLTDYSGNSIDFKVNVVPVCDKIRPEYVGYEVEDRQRKIVLEFSEDVFETGEFKLIDKDNNEIEVDFCYYIDENNKANKNKLVLTKMDLSHFDSGKYTLTISKVVDLTPLKNEIIEKTVVIEVGDQIAPYINMVSRDFEHNEIYVKFNEKVDKASAENKANYIYTLDNYLTECLNDSADITLLPDEQTVCIKFKKDETNGINVGNILRLQVESVCDLAGNKMKINNWGSEEFDTIGKVPDHIEELPSLPKYSEIYADYYGNKIYVMFDKKIDKALAESKANYLYITNNIIYRGLNEYTTVKLLSDGKTVCIQFPKDYKNIGEENYIDVNKIYAFQVNEAAYLSGEKVPVQAFLSSYFIDVNVIGFTTKIVSAAVTDKNRITLKLNGSIDESTLTPSDFNITTLYGSKYYITAYDAEYDEDNMEIILSVGPDIKSDGTYKGIPLKLSMDYYNTETTNIFGKILTTASSSITIEDAYAPYVESVTRAVYNEGWTEFYITISEDLEINYEEYLESTDLDQFTVKVNGEKVEAKIVYYNADYYDDIDTPVNEEYARFRFILDGKYDEEEIEVIFTPYDETNFKDYAGNKLKAFSVKILPV